MDVAEADDGAIEIEDDIWDVVDAIVALVCEINGEPYFDADDGAHDAPGEEHFFEALENCAGKASSNDAERSSLLATTNKIVWNVVEAVSSTFPRMSYQTLQDDPELSSKLKYLNDYEDQPVDDEAILRKGTSHLEQSEPAVEKSLAAHHVLETSSNGHNSSLHSDSLHSDSTLDTFDDSRIDNHDRHDFRDLSPKEIQLSTDQGQLHVQRSRRVSIDTETMSPLLSQASSGRENEEKSSLNDDSSKHVAIRVTGENMHFVHENSHKTESNESNMTALLLDFATGSNKQKSNETTLKIVCMLHPELRKMTATRRFSCFANEKETAPIFTGLSLLHIVCINKDKFDESVYNDFIYVGCKPDEESSNGCNVYAFAACQGNLQAMKHIAIRHADIFKMTLCRCRNENRNLLNCIIDHAKPADYTVLLDCLGPSVCTDLCAKLEGRVGSPLFAALEKRNYSFIRSISKQTYIWNIATADRGDEQTFLSVMMTSPHAHAFLITMLANITSLESFVVQYPKGGRVAPMMLRASQMGYKNILSQVLKQQHLLYFLELDKAVPFLINIDPKKTRTGLIAFLSQLLEKHCSETVTLWHCIHLVVSLSDDEEMALDLLSMANLAAVQSHHHWRSFDRLTGESALHIAAHRDWTEVISCLCDLGHDINPFCFMMRTPMHASALHNSLKSIVLLNNLGADASIENGDGKSPINCSIETKNIECSMEILGNIGSKKSMFQTDSKGLSPLMRALETKQLQIAHRILKQYPEQANFVSMNGTNIFHAAAPHLASVQQLVSWSSQEKKDIWGFLQQKNNDGETPKDIAAHCGYLDSLRFFMQIYQSKGAAKASKSLQETDVYYSESMEAFTRTDFKSAASIQRFVSIHSESINCYDFYHRTPFILTVQAKNLQGAQVFVDAGADILQTDALGNSGMHYMFLAKRDQSLWMWEQGMGSDTDPSDMLHCIIQRNSEDIVASCLTLKNKAGVTPFCLAMMNEFYADVALLCGEAKFPKNLLNIQLPTGTYCLHIACSKNLIDLAALFLNLGSDPLVVDSNDMSPEYIARSYGHNSITLILMQFCNALKIQCAIRGFLCRVHALKNREDHIAVQNVIFKMIENPNTLMQQYSDLRTTFPRANWNSLEHPIYPDMVPMACAAMYNNIKALKFILDLKLSPNIRGKVTGSSPLAFAVERGSTDSIKLLLAAAANVNNCDHKKRTPVHCAAEKGFLGSLKILGEFHPNYNALDQNQCTPMMLSLTSGSFLTSKPLIEYSEETMNVPCHPSGNTPLLEAISRSADMDVVKAILIHGGEVLVTNNDGQTALGLSLLMGNAVLEFIFRELIVWCDGFRELRSLPLDERAFFIDVIFEVAEIFESHGDSSDRNSKLQDLTRMASKNHRFTSIQWLLSPSTGGLEFLDISSCLLMACDSPIENLKIIVALLKFRKKCAKPREIMEHVDAEGRSVVHVCAMHGHCNALALLIDEIHSERAVCNFDMQDACGRSPFFLACQGGHIEVVKNLMQYSEVNLHLGDAAGERPIVAALISGCLDVVAAIFEVDPTTALDVSNNGTSILHIIAAKDEYLPLAIRVMSIPKGRSLLGCARHTLTDNGTVESSLPIDIAVKYEALKMVSHLRKMSMSLQEKKILNLQTQIAAKMAGYGLLHSQVEKSPKVIITRDSMFRRTQANLLQNNVRCFFARKKLKKHRATFLVFCRRIVESIVADDVQAISYVLREWPALIRIMLKDGLSALYLACENAAAGVLDHLLANGIDANEVDQRNRNCLHHAVLSTKASFVRKIAALQVSHSLQDYQGNTPLHLACISGDSAVADELMYLSSAPLGVENKEKLNPDEVAIINGHDALARKLVETKKHSSTQWDDFGGKTKFSSKVEADWITIRQNAIRRKAVTQLQCACRNYGSRNAMRMLKMKYHFRNQAATLIKLNLKAALARKIFCLNVQANILQRNWIVHKSRVFYVELKEQKRIVQARLLIYYAMKMHGCRRNYKPQKAALCIQRVFWGHVSRKPYKDFLDKYLVRKRNFFSRKLQSAMRQHVSRNLLRMRKIFASLRSLFARSVAFRKIGPEIQWLSLRRSVQHITRCAKSFLHRRNYGVITGNLNSLRYYLPQILCIQRAYSSHKHLNMFRSVREKHHLAMLLKTRQDAASVVSNNWRVFTSKRCLKMKEHHLINFNTYLLQFYVLKRMETESSFRKLRDSSSKIANMYRNHKAKSQIHYLKGEPMRQEKIYVEACSVSRISRQVRCYLAKMKLKGMLHDAMVSSRHKSANCIVGGWRCLNARRSRRLLATAAHQKLVTRGGHIVSKFFTKNAKSYRFLRQKYQIKWSVRFLSTYMMACCVRILQRKIAMLSVIQRSWRVHRARLLVRKLNLRRLQGVLNPRLSGKAKRNGSRSLSSKQDKSALNQGKLSPSRRGSTKKIIRDGELVSTADADEDVAICDSEYDLEDKAQVFSRYLSQSKPKMIRSDSVPLPVLDPLWKETRSSTRPSSSASVRHYISCTVPSELGLGTEHRGNIKRLLEAKSFGENDFFPAPRVDYIFDKHSRKRPSSSASSRPSSSIATKTVLITSLSSSKVPAEQISATLHGKIESPFQASAFENAVRKNNPQLALQIAESNLTTAKTSQSQEQYDAYILALVSFAITEAIKIVPDKNDSSSLILLQIADETIRSRGQHLEDKHLLRVWCLDALSMYYYYRNKYHAAEEASIKAIRCVDHRLSTENHSILLQHAGLIRLRNGKPKDAESSARRAIRVIYPSFDPDVCTDAETTIPLPPVHSLGLVGSLLNFCTIMHKTAQGPKALTSLNVSIHLLQEMMPFQSAEAVRLMSLAASIRNSM